MTNLVEEKSIKFPAKSYLGVIGRPGDNLTLAFMTEDGTDSAAKKRKETVDQWVRQNSRSRPNGDKQVATTRSMDNKPLVGFRLGRSIRRDSSWGAGNVKWRIEDPRGFELEITSPNMAQIVDSCVIQNGEILDECIWARLKGDNVLVPVSSQLYQTAARNVERMATKVAPKDVERGDHVVLHNGTEGVYLGKFESLIRHYGNQSTLKPVFSYDWKAKPVHAMIVTHTNGVRVIHTFATFKPSYLTKREGGPMTPEEAETAVWEVVDNQRYSSERLFLAKTPIVYTETETTLAEHAADKDYSLLVCLLDGEMYKASFQSYEYDHYIAQLSGTASTSYGYRSGKPGLTKVAIREEDGAYMIWQDSGHYGRGKTITFEELEKLPLRLLSASIATHDGVPRKL